MTEEHNPPAFPVPELRDRDGCGLREGSVGMTLRDWFAGQALAGIAAKNAPVIETLDRYFSVASDAAYRFADAMLVARKEPTQ